MFSVIIPNFNRQQSIMKAVKSVLEQTYLDFEVIVVDDCSTDNSLVNLSKLTDKRLEVFRLKKNSGAAAARNYGINQSKGQYISLLDSDDFYEPEFLQKTFNFISKTPRSIGFSWTGVRYIEKGKVYEKIWQPKRMESPYLTFLNSLHIGTNSGITFKRTIFNTVDYFNENLPAAEDTDFFLRLVQQFDYIVVPEILINIERDNCDRLSKDSQKIGKSYNIFLSQHFPVIDKSMRLSQKFYYKMMWLNYHLDDKEKARYYYNKIPKKLRSLKMRIIKSFYEILPLKITTYLHKRLSYMSNF